MKRVIAAIAAISVMALFSHALGADGNWPAFRGGGRACTIDDANLPDAWSDTRNVAWKTKLPGRGWSSPIVWGDRVFLTTVVSEGKEPDIKKGLYMFGEQKKPPEDVHHWTVLCLDAKTGQFLWKRTAHQAKPGNTVHGKNTYASETPVTDGERLYAYFGNVGLFCYDLEGEQLWTVKWDPVKTRNGWGAAASPVLHGERLYLVNDNEEKSFLVALDKRTGKQIWRVERDEKSNWATPFIWENEKRTEIVTPGTGKTRSYDLDGKLLWEFGPLSGITIPTPSARHGLLYVGSGFVLDRNRTLYAVRPGAAGDITLKEGQSSSDYVAWSLPQGAPYHPSPLAYGDHVYVLQDRGFLSCYDARTGKALYERQRLDQGANAFTASPWGAGGKVFCLSEDGDCFVVQAGPEFKVLGKNSLNEMCMATPAAAKDRLFLRTLGHLYCIRP